MRCFYNFLSDKKKREKWDFFALPQFILRRHRCVPKPLMCPRGRSAKRAAAEALSLPFPFQVEDGWGVYSWLGSLSCGFVFPKLHLSVFSSPPEFCRGGRPLKYRRRELARLGFVAAAAIILQAEIRSGGISFILCRGQRY